MTDLGPYRIVRLVGQGGMGVVYEAVHTGLDKRVALKVLQLLAGDRLDRFLREARTAAALHHTNIVPVFDAGQVNGVPYYAMQFIDGRPLDGLLKPPAGPLPVTAPHVEAGPPPTGGTHTFEPGAATADPAGIHRDFSTGDVLRGVTRPRPSPLDPKHIAGLGLQAAEGLAYAHERGVVHRDVKPSNLILDATGVVWVADFGLAYHVDDATMTADGAVIGTPRYMSPEQARGEKTDPRTDVCSLGITLYELLTGTAAYAGSSVADTLRRAIDHTPPRPRSLNRAVPRDLETVVLKAMAKRPADRYPSGRELADDLRRFVAGEPVTARRIGPVGRGWRWAKRNPAVASLLAAVLVVFAAGAGVSAYYAGRAAEKAAEAKFNEGVAGAMVTAADMALARNDLLLSDARASLYAARMNLACIAQRDGDSGRASELLRDAYPAAGGEDLRGWEWHALFRLVHPPARVHKLAAGQTVFDLGPSRAVLAGGDGYKILDAITAREVEPAVSDADVETRYGTAYWKDGRVVLYRRADGPLVLRDAARGTDVGPLPVGGDEEPVPGGMAGDRLVSVAKAGDGYAFRVYDTAARRLVCRLDGHPAGFRPDSGSTAISPDGRFFAAWGARDLLAWNARTGEPVFVYHTDAEHAAVRCVLGPHGRIVYETPGVDHLKVAVLPDAPPREAGGRPTPDLAPTATFGFSRTGPTSEIALSPTGRYLALARDRWAGELHPDAAVYDLDDPSRQPVEVRWGLPGGVTAGRLAFDADGVRLLVAASGARDDTFDRYLLAVDLSDRLAPAADGLGGERRESSPCGRWEVRYGRSDRSRYWQSVEVREAATGRTRFHLPEAAGEQPLECSWSPDGSRLLVEVEEPAVDGPPAAAVGAAACAGRRSKPPSLRIVDPAAGRVTARTDRPPLPSSVLAFSPCGRWLLVEGYADWAVLDTASLGVVLRSDRACEVCRLAATPDGRLVCGEKLPAADAGEGGGRWEWTAWDLPTGRRLARQPTPATGHAPVVDPAGRWVAFGLENHEQAGPAALFYDLADPAAEPRAVPLAPETEGREDAGLVQGAVDPAGRRTAWLTAGEVVVLDPATGDREQTIRWEQRARLFGPSDGLTLVGGRLLIGQGKADGCNLTVFDPATGRQVAGFRSARASGGYAPGPGLRFEFVTFGAGASPDVRFLDGSPVPDEEARRRLGLSPPP